MAFDIIPRGFWHMPRVPSIFDEDDTWLSTSSSSSGLSVSEDDKQVYVEAAVPGVNPDDIEVTYDRGTLWIKGQHQEVEEDKKKKYYRKAASSFSYHVTVPGEIDANKEPDVMCKDGVVKVTFDKQPEVQPKKLNVRKE